MSWLEVVGVLFIVLVGIGIFCRMLSYLMEAGCAGRHDWYYDRRRCKHCARVEEVEP